MVLLMSAALWAALIAVAHAEVIRSFDSDIVVNEDGSFTVTETIVYDFEGLQKHGIFRNIKDKHPQGSTVLYKTRNIDLSLESVTMDGQSVPYTLPTYNGLSVKIGDPNNTISGLHTYVITYRVVGGLARYDDGVEVYWNVNGNEWTVPIQKVTAEVRAPYTGGLLPVSVCYVGLSGSDVRCQNNEVINDIGYFEQVDLSPGHQLTIAQRLDFVGDTVVLEQVNYVPLIGIVLLIGLIYFVVWAYRWHFKYRTKESIIARYEPLPDYNPMFTGVLFDGSLDNRDISASIIYLAQQGYLKIKQISQKVMIFKSVDYEITLLKPVDLSESSFNDEILSFLFDEIGTEYQTIKLSDLKRDQNKLLANHRTQRILQDLVKEEMVRTGFFERRFSTMKALLYVVFVVFGTAALMIILLIVAAPYLAVNNTDDLAILVSLQFLVPPVLFIVILVWLILAVERRTRSGYEALNYLKGFKDFLSTTEKDRYRFHNAPSLNPEKFMEYLPYAIAFGVEKEWADVFKDIQITPPDWYQSDIPGNCNAAALSSSVGAFSMAFARSSGSSGSSGGGHSGGGGGGGGGGSW